MLQRRGHVACGRLEKHVHRAGDRLDIREVADLIAALRVDHVIEEAPSELSIDGAEAQGLQAIHCGERVPIVDSGVGRIQHLLVGVQAYLQFGHGDSGLVPQAGQQRVHRCKICLGQRQACVGIGRQNGGCLPRGAVELAQCLQGRDSPLADQVDLSDRQLVLGEAGRLCPQGIARQVLDDSAVQLERAGGEADAVSVGETGRNRVLERQDRGWITPFSRRYVLGQNLLISDLEFELWRARDLDRLGKGDGRRDDIPGLQQGLVCHQTQPCRPREHLGRLGVHLEGRIWLLPRMSRQGLVAGQISNGSAQAVAQDFNARLRCLPGGDGVREGQRVRARPTCVDSGHIGASDLQADLRQPLHEDGLGELDLGRDDVPGIEQAACRTLGLRKQRLYDGGRVAIDGDGVCGFAGEIACSVCRIHTVLAVDQALGWHRHA